MSESTGAGDCGCKVGRMIAKYELADVDDELADRWIREDGDSLRELAATFNRRLLERTMARHGEQPLDGEVENVYRLLTDDDVSSGMRTQVRKRLERRGIDVESTEADLVSYQTIYRHLNDCLDVSYPTDDREPGASAEKIFALQSRAAVVTEDTLERLRGDDRLDIENFDVFVDISVTCTDCGAYYGIRDLLEAGGCSCRSPE